MSVQNSKTKTAIFSLVPLALVSLLVGIGFLLGRGTATSLLWKQLKENEHTRTLGDKVRKDDPRRQAISLAYLDQETAYNEMDGYAYVTSHVVAPFVGHGPKPGQHANAFISDLQIRGNSQLERPKSSGVYRIFLIGGSTAFGSGAPDDQRTIGGYLESILEASELSGEEQHFEVLTLAQPAWVSSHERIIVENRIIELEPDLVISFSGANDLFWASRGRNVLWFRAFADEHYFRVLNGVYELLGLTPMPDVTTISEDPIPCKTMATRLARNVAITRYALQMVGADYLYVLQPTRHRHEGRSAEEESYELRCGREVARVLAELRSGGLWYLSLVALFDGQPVESIFFDDLHFGDRGNKQAAEAIASDVLRRLRDRPS